MRSCPRCLSPYAAELEFCGIDGTRLEITETDPLIGHVVDRFQVVAHLGEGGMARVYRAKHRVLEHEYALKVLFGEIAADKKLAERFRREAQVISKLSHPNIVSVLDFGATTEGLTFLTMELIPGQNLRTIIKTEAPLEPLRTAAIARQVAAGLAAAHAGGFVHRDLKPSNIMVAEEQGSASVKLLDFGLVHAAEPAGEEPAYLTRTGQFVGTPLYTAPEQIIGGEVTHHADLYALGVVIYEMLNGEPPFKAKSLAEIRRKHIHEPAPTLPPSLGLEHLVASLLEKSIPLRPKDAEQVVETIDAILNKHAEATTQRAEMPLRSGLRIGGSLAPHRAQSSSRSRPGWEGGNRVAQAARVDAVVEATRIIVPTPAAVNDTEPPVPRSNRQRPISANRQAEDARLSSRPDAGAAASKVDRRASDGAGRRAASGPKLPGDKAELVRASSRPGREASPPESAVSPPESAVSPPEGAVSPPEGAAAPPESAAAPPDERMGNASPTEEVTRRVSLISAARDLLSSMSGAEQREAPNTRDTAISLPATSLASALVAEITQAPLDTGTYGIVKRSRWMIPGLAASATIAIVVAVALAASPETKTIPVNRATGQPTPVAPTTSVPGHSAVPFEATGPETQAALVFRNSPELESHEKMPTSAPTRPIEERRPSNTTPHPREETAPRSNRRSPSTERPHETSKGPQLTSRDAEACISKVLASRGLSFEDLERDPTHRAKLERWRNAVRTNQLAALRDSNAELERAIRAYPITLALVRDRLDRLNARLRTAAATLPIIELRPLEDRYLEIAKSVTPRSTPTELEGALVKATDLTRAIARTLARR